MKCPPFKTVSRTLLLAAMLFMVLGADRSTFDVKIPGISQRVNSFTLDFLKQHARAENLSANTILSPQSIFHGLAISYIASGGDTREELHKVFHFPEKNEVLLKELGELRKQMHQAGEHERMDLGMANSVWLDERYADFRKMNISSSLNFPISTAPFPYMSCCLKSSLASLN